MVFALAFNLLAAPLFAHIRSDQSTPLSVQMEVSKSGKSASLLHDICPCPTMIEGADCDESLCSGLIASIQSNPGAFLRQPQVQRPLSALLDKYGQPDYPPPRLIV
ncbi:MAG: hypothetical protein ABJP02_00285 [Parasphingorhabdus sp.]|uniref:hypothetical protein n=1 Tax=Alphaproteobacteria TaxID=28211 RepID=UPI0032982B3F